MVEPPRPSMVAPPQQPQRGSAPIYESSAPKLVPASQKKRGSSERVQKVAIIGSAGTGKTFTILSMVQYLAIVNKMLPEQIRVEMIDLDGGLDELTDQYIIPDEYLDRIFVATCQNFSEVVDATKDAYDRLAEHRAKYGSEGCWIVVDNMEKAWEYPQEDYCQTVYGQSLVEKMKEARKSQVEAKKLGLTGQGVFDKNLDWGTIKPMHADWAKSFETCGFNVLWLSPWKMDEKKNTAGVVIEAKEKFGAGGNDLKVSYIIKKYLDDGGNRRADFLKSRSTKGNPKNITDTTWAGMWKALKDLEVLEAREKQAKMKQAGFPDLTGKYESINEPVEATKPSQAAQTAQTDDGRSGW
jgi:hypothetical protein